MTGDRSECAGKVLPSGREGLRARADEVPDLAVHLLGRLLLGNQAVRRMEVEGVLALGQYRRHAKAHEADANGYEKLDRTLGEVELAVSKDDIWGRFAYERLQLRLSRRARCWAGRPLRAGRGTGVENLNLHLLEAMLRVGELLSDPLEVAKELADVTRWDRGSGVGAGDGARDGRSRRRSGGAVGLSGGGHQLSDGAGSGSGSAGGRRRSRPRAGAADRRLLARSGGSRGSGRSGSSGSSGSSRSSVGRGTLADSRLGFRGHRKSVRQIACRRKRKKTESWGEPPNKTAAPNKTAPVSHSAVAWGHRSGRDRASGLTSRSFSFFTKIRTRSTRFDENIYNDN